MKKALHFITNLKFFAVVLVVLGHAIQYTYTDTFDNVFLFRFIYSFHMPLFMFISGYLLNISRKDNFIKRRITSLVIPFFSWSVFYCIFYSIGSNVPFSDFVIEYWVGLFKSPDNRGLWFLWALFVCNLLYFAFMNFRFKYIYYAITILALNVLFYLPNTHFLGLGLVRWYFLFFVMGLFFGEKQITNKLFENVVLIISLVAASFLVFKFKRNGVISNLHGRAFMIQMVYNLLVACSMLVFLYLFFKKFLNINISQINWVSQQSLGFYAVQFIFTTYSKSFFLLFSQNLVLVCFFSFVSVMVLSGFTVYLISKVPILKKLLLGS